MLPGLSGRDGNLRERTGFYRRAAVGLPMDEDNRTFVGPFRCLFKYGLRSARFELESIRIDT